MVVKLFDWYNSAKSNKVQEKQKVFWEKERVSESVTGMAELKVKKRWRMKEKSNKEKERENKASSVKEKISKEK